jgi:hypothetical protein
VKTSGQLKLFAFKLRALIYQGFGRSLFRNFFSNNPILLTEKVFFTCFQELECLKFGHYLVGFWGVFKGENKRIAVCLMERFYDKFWLAKKDY